MITKTKKRTPIQKDDLFNFVYQLGDNYYTFETLQVWKLKPQIITIEPFWYLDEYGRIFNESEFKNPIRVKAKWLNPWRALCDFSVASNGKYFRFTIAESTKGTGYWVIEEPELTGAPKNRRFGVENTGFEKRFMGPMPVEFGVRWKPGNSYRNGTTRFIARDFHWLIGNNPTVGESFPTLTVPCSTPLTQKRKRLAKSKNKRQRAATMANTNKQQAAPVKPLVYTVNQAAEILKVHRNTVMEWIYNGTLPAYKVGRGLRIKAKDLENMLKPVKLKTAQPSCPEGDGV